MGTIIRRRPPLEKSVEQGDMTVENKDADRRAISRRGAAQLLAAGTLAAMVPFEVSAAGPGVAYAGKRIDVHHHFLPPVYRDALAAAGMVLADGIPALPAWSEAAMIAMMDDLSIERAILSISSPGVHFGDDAAARRLSRQVNEEGARLAAAHPGRIGFFASTPLPDIPGAVAEVIHALDHLGASGVIFESNFHGIYLGDAQLAPVYAELDRRGAMIFTHPTSPTMSCSCGPGGPDHPIQDVAIGLGFPTPLIEFIFETTRSITNMVMSGTLGRYPNIKVLVPHAGAALPVLTSRIDTVASMLKKEQSTPMREALHRLHFDLAGMPIPEMLMVLLNVADHAKIHYGSDWPYTPIPACHALANAIEQSPLLSPELLSSIMYRNADTLFNGST